MDSVIRQATFSHTAPVRFRPTKSEPSTRNTSSLELLCRPKLLSKSTRSVNYDKISQSLRSSKLSGSPTDYMPCLCNESREKRKEKILNTEFLRRAFSFHHPTNLSRLSISSMGLTSVDILSMKEFTNLCYIDAGDNHLNLESFAIFPNLQELHLPLNHISKLTLASNQFMVLQILDLSFNNMDPSGIFNLSKLFNLKMLNLTANYLSKIPSNIRISSFPSLEVLILDDNKLATADTFLYLSRLRNLKTLSLEGNRFQCIPHIDTLATLSSIQMCLIDSWLSEESTETAPVLYDSSLSDNIVSQWSMSASSDSDESQTSIQNWTSDIYISPKQSVEDKMTTQEVTCNDQQQQEQAFQQETEALPQQNEAVMQQNEAMAQQNEAIPQQSKRFPLQTKSFKIKSKSSVKRQPLKEIPSIKTVKNMNKFPVHQHPSRMIARTGAQILLHYLKRPGMTTGFWPMDPKILRQLMGSKIFESPPSRKAILKNIDQNVMPWHRRVLMESAEAPSSEFDEDMIENTWTPVREPTIIVSEITKVPRFKSSLEQTSPFTFRRSSKNYSLSTPSGSHIHLLKRSKSLQEKESGDEDFYADSFGYYDRFKTAKSLISAKTDHGKHHPTKIDQTGVFGEMMHTESDKHTNDNKDSSLKSCESAEVTKSKVKAKKGELQSLDLIGKLWSNNRDKNIYPRLQMTKCSQNLPKQYQRLTTEPVYFKDERNPHPPFAELQQLNLARNKVKKVEDASAIATWQSMKEIVLTQNPVNSTRVLDLNPIRPYMVSKIEIPFLTRALDTSNIVSRRPHIRKYQPTNPNSPDPCLKNWTHNLKKTVAKENVAACKCHFVPNHATQEMHTKFSLDIHEKNRRGVKNLPLPFLRLCEYKKLLEKTLASR